MMQDFRVFIKRSESEEKGVQAGDQLLFTMLQAGLIDQSVFANLFGRATPDLVASSLRKFQQDKAMAQQSADQASNQGIQQGGEQEQAMMQMMGQAAQQEQEGQVLGKQMDQENSPKGTVKTREGRDKKREVV